MQQRGARGAADALGEVVGTARIALPDTRLDVSQQLCRYES
jgi:hypothetical protein